MLIEKEKILFIHVARTAGTSIERYFSPDLPEDQNPLISGKNNTDFQDKHKTARRYKASLGERTFNQMFKFCFIRNPWDLEVSLWKWLSIAVPIYKNLTFKNHLIRRIGSGKMSFSFYTDVEGENKMDFIGKFEDLQSDFNILCEKLNLPIKTLQHTNKTEKEQYSSYYNNETRSIVEKYYEKEINIFDYKFHE